MSERPVYTDNFVYVGLSLNLAETDWKSPIIWSPSGSGYGWQVGRYISYQGVVGRASDDRFGEVKWSSFFANLWRASGISSNKIFADMMLWWSSSDWTTAAKRKQ